MGVWVGVVGALDWGEGSEKYSVDDEETFETMGGACDTLNLARRRVSEAWWDNFLSLSNPSGGPVAFDEPDSLLAGPAPGLTSGLEVRLSITLALPLLLNGNGNNFESGSFAMLLVGWAENGKMSPRGGHEA